MSLEELDRIPALLPLYGRAVAASLGGGEELPDDEVVVRDVRFDADHLAAYDRVCGFTLRDAVPSTYPHIVAFPLTVHLMARRSFPFPLVGLVHLGQRIEQRRAIAVDEAVTVQARTADLRPHAKGQQFDVIADVEVAGEPVWRAVSTYLRRGAVPVRRRRTRGRRSTARRRRPGGSAATPAGGTPRSRGTATPST
jgi:hypothetical protein